MIHGFLFGMGLVVALMFGPVIILNLGKILKTIFFAAGGIVAIAFIIYDPTYILVIGGVVFVLFIIALVKILFERWQQRHPSAAAKARRELHALNLLVGIFLCAGLAALLTVFLAKSIAIEIDRPDLFSIGSVISDLITCVFIAGLSGMVGMTVWRWRRILGDAGYNVQGSNDAVARRPKANPAPQNRDEEIKRA